MNRRTEAAYRIFKEGVATALTRAGYPSEAGAYCIRILDCEFYCDLNRRGTSWRFLDREYRAANEMSPAINNAIIDVLRELPQQLLYAEKERQRRKNEAAAKELTRQLDCGITVTYVRDEFVLTYHSSDIAEIAAAAKDLASKMAAAWDALLASPPVYDVTVKFTSEGGFSLN